MNIGRALEREEDLLEQEYESGELSGQEYQRQLRELHRDARWEVEEEAERAAEEERAYHGFGRDWY